MGNVAYFPNGVQAPFFIGGGRSNMFAAGNVWFVDGDNGSDDNPGSGPSVSCASISGAVSKASKGGIIYVRPRMTVASAQSYYTDNITTPLTKPQLSILGCGNDLDKPYLSVAVKAATAGVGLPVLTVQGSGFLTESMEWTGTGQTADTASIVYVSNDGTIALTDGLAIRNCSFRNAKGHAVSGTYGGGGAIQFETPINYKVQNCGFHECLNSITFRTSYAAVNNLLIQDCYFTGANTSRDTDIQTNAVSGRGFIVDNCKFADSLPNHGSNNRYIYFSGGTGLQGQLSNCTFAATGTNLIGLLAAAGALGYVPASIFIINCQMESSTEQYNIIAR
jgi:hypothetical protein